MVNSHFIKFLRGKQSFYKVFSNDSYDQLKSHIFAWLVLNPDYAPVKLSMQVVSEESLNDVPIKE
jgi:hypothetical protein